MGKRRQQKQHTHSLILLLCLSADDFLHIVGWEPQLFLAPVVPPPPARGERIKARGPIGRVYGVLMLHAMSRSNWRRKGETEKEVVKTDHRKIPARGNTAQGTRPLLPATILLVNVVDDGLLAE